MLSGPEQKDDRGRSAAQRQLGALRLLCMFSAPEVDPEAAFEESDGGDVPPGCAGADAVHGLVGNAAGVRDIA